MFDLTNNFIAFFWFMYCDEIHVRSSWLQHCDIDYSHGNNYGLVFAFNNTCYFTLCPLNMAYQRTMFTSKSLCKSQQVNS
jgi:hypothetical protein